MLFEVVTHLQRVSPLAAIVFAISSEDVSQDELVFRLAARHFSVGEMRREFVRCCPQHTDDTECTIGICNNTTATDFAAFFEFQIRVFHQWLYKASAAKYAPYPYTWPPTPKTSFKD